MRLFSEARLRLLLVNKITGLPFFEQFFCLPQCFPTRRVLEDDTVIYKGKYCLAILPCVMHYTQRLH